MKRVLCALIGLIMMLMLTSCAEENADVLFDNAGLKVENLPEWTLEINYISETRGKPDRIYTQISGSTSTFLDVVNTMYAAEKIDPPEEYLFSAEAMCNYRLDLFHLDESDPSISFYYYKDNDMLINITRHEEDDTEIIDYTFYKPYGELAAFLDEQRSLAITPQHSEDAQFLSVEELIASISDEEMEELTETKDFNDALDFEFYRDEKPKYSGTSSQIFSSRTFAAIPPEHYLILARTATLTGEPLDLSIIGLQFTQMFTKVLVSYPDQELYEELGIAADNTILVRSTTVPKEKWIVFIDEDNNIVDIIVPSVMVD